MATSFQPNIIPVITNWISYTPTGSWVSNTTYTGRYRRVGDTAELAINVATTGAPTSASLTINLPSGLVIDTTKLPTTTDMILGVGQVRDSGSTNFEANVYYSTTTAVSVLVGDVSTYQRISASISASVPMTFANGDNVNIIFQVPIVGWSA